MKVAGMQPTFLPWQGYFELIYQSDRFVFADDISSRMGATISGTDCSSAARWPDWYTVPLEAKESLDGR